MDTYIAKSHPQATIREHIEDLFTALSSLMAAYPECLTEKELDLIRLAVEYHDYGKVNYMLQKKISLAARLFFKIDEAMEQLYQDIPEVPHGYLSPAFIPIGGFTDKDDLFSVVNAVFYHHKRPECKDKEIVDVIEKDLKRRLGESYPLNKRYLSLVMRPENSQDTQRWLRYAVTKGILNRLDYAASAGTAEEIELPSLQNGLTLGQLVEKEIRAQGYSLRPVQLYMKANRDKNLVVTASTGIGKTEAACLWADGNKFFYTLPLKISINAIYERLHGSGNAQYGYQNSILLHSDAFSALMENDTEEAEPRQGEETLSREVLGKIKKARNFSYPVTICTVDQIFTFVYKYIGCEMIPATLRYSCVVVDEIQAYSPEIAARLIYGLGLISELGGKFAIITATMPPVLEDFMRRKGIPFEEPAPFFSELSRHILDYSAADFDYEQIAQRGDSAKVLVICNTVKRAVAVYRNLYDVADCKVQLLHSRFRRRDRQLLEAEIMRFSCSDECGIWVSTQIVEASLDIDFDLLFTEMCPADSLLQRLGRCFRKRQYTALEPNVYICDVGTGRRIVYKDDLIYERSVELLQKYCGKLFSESDKFDYVREVYSTEALKRSQYYKMLNQSYDNLKNITPGLMSKDDAQQKFREIFQYNVMDEQTYQQLLNSGEIDFLRKALVSKDRVVRMQAENRLLGYTVSVRPNFQENQRAKTPLFSDIGGGNIPKVYRIQSKYDFDEMALQGCGLLEEPMDQMTNMI